jgi:hypothetical protein
MPHIDRINVVMPESGPAPLIPGWNAPFPENPEVVRARERANAAAAERERQAGEAKLERARALRAEIEQRREAIRAEKLQADLDAEKERRRESYRLMGVVGAEFEKRWSDHLRQIQDEAVNSDPLQAEKDRLRSQSRYSM